MDQRENDGRVASLLDRLDEFGKRRDMSLARRSENEEMIREIEKTVKEKMCSRRCGFDCHKKVRWEPDPLDFGKQEDLDQEELNCLQYELGADGEFG